MRIDFQKELSQKRFILPPLSGYTDYPYRCILSLFHPPFICTEMVNATALVNGNKKTLDMLTMEPGDHLKGVQLVGNNPQQMSEAASIIESLGFDFIDVNMGCTVKKVVNKGQGVALMKDEALASSIVESICSSVDIPVTVKIRTGISQSKKNAVNLSKKLEKSGVYGITVHGRSGERKFGITVDYDIIKKIAASIDIPVIANGGINHKNALDILNYTGACAIMPGRNLIGNPWLVDQLKTVNNNFEVSIPKLTDRKDIVEKHLQRQCRFYGEYNGVRQFRSILPKYFRYCHQLNKLKDDSKQCQRIDDVKMILQRLSETDDMIQYQ